MKLKLGSRVLLLLIALVVFAPAFLHSAEGRIYVTSDPEGASIIVVKTEGGNTVEHPTQATTPGMVPLEVRVEPYELILRKEGFKEKRFSVQVAKAAILKPEIQKLEPATRNVDILYEEAGWQVFIDGKTVNDAEGNAAKTPCTIQLPDGAKEVQLAKEGFNDFTMRVGEEKSLEFKGKPWKGQSKVLQSPAAIVQSQNSDQASYVGTWEIPKFGTFIVTGNGKNYHLEQVGHFQSGTTIVQDRKLAFNWPTNNPVAIVFAARDGKVYIGCYNRPNGKFDKSLFEGTPIWEYEATKK